MLMTVSSRDRDGSQRYQLSTVGNLAIISVRCTGLLYSEDEEVSQYHSTSD